MKYNQKKSEHGFSLIESLISLSLSTIIVLACLEFFSHTRVLFTKIKEKFESTESIYFTFDRIRIDLQCGGQGLLTPINLGVLEPINISADQLAIFSREKKIELKDDLFPGQTHIQLEDIKGLKKNRILCIFDSQQGEMKNIAGVDSTGISLSTQLKNHYQLDSTTALLIRTISIYMDKESHILRRKINNSPAQPLLENTLKFKCFYEGKKLIYFRIYMKNEEDKFYEINFVPKNSSFASIHQTNLPPG